MNLPGFMADAAPDLGAYGGWAGAGLLGLVLSWLLLKHVPQLIDAHRGSMQTMADAHVMALKQTRDDHKEALKLITDHCREELAGTVVPVLTGVQAAIVRLESGLDKLTDTIRRVPSKIT